MPGQNADCLIVFAKPPVEGSVKTRLVPRIGPKDATDLYRAFLIDALSQYSRLGYAVRLYFADGPLPPHLGVDLSSGDVIRQRGDGLGERMANAFLDTFAEGFNRAVIIGTDHPSLPDDFVRLAFDSLDDPSSVVLGPSEDGGFYLMGLRHFFPSLFTGMEYSHNRVYEQTVDRAIRAGAALTVLPMWYDVDTPEVLVRLLQDLQPVPDQAPATLSLLETVIDRHGLA